jgi:DNA-nicking Smr family endonuclease
MARGDGDLTQMERDLIELGGEFLYHRPGLRHGIWKQLRRGELPVEGRIDLHGATLPVARALVAEYIQVCQGEGRRVILLIHGKGQGSAHREPILKPMLNAWLRRRAEVLAFVPARPRDGGEGAAYVLLRPR